MNKAFSIIAAVSIATPAAAQTVSYNSAPTGGFQYGTGNNYTPANAAVLTGTNVELASRFHIYQMVAPASVGNVYTFALGSTPLSFDWSIGGVPVSSTAATITLTNLLTGISVSYNPLCPIAINCAFNDNVVTANGDYQNSARLTFAQFAALTFDPMQNNTFRMDLTAGGNTLTTFARIGNGGAVPEPATWAMMLVGFGGIGGMMRHQRKSRKLAQIA